MDNKTNNDMTSVNAVESLKGITLDELTNQKDRKREYSIKKEHIMMCPQGEYLMFPLSDATLFFDKAAVKECVDTMVEYLFREAQGQLPEQPVTYLSSALREAVKRPSSLRINHKIKSDE